MDLQKIIKWRYSTKSFDPSKKISSEHEKDIKTLLRWSPSSINTQPWHFIISSTAEGKERLAKGTMPYNQPKVMDASHVVLFCAKTDISDDYLHHITDQEDGDGRFPKEGARAGQIQVKTLFTNIHRYDLKDAQHWMEKQVYLNLGQFLLGVAALGIDAVPMEGVDAKALDEEFGLREKGYTALVMVGLGHRAEDDFNAKLPKSRLPEEEIFTII